MRLSLMIFLFVIALPAFAKTSADDECEERLDPHVREFDENLCQLPKVFRSGPEIRRQLSAPGTDLIERAPSQPHRQWRGTCYLYNSIALLDGALHRRGLLAHDDYVDSFMLAMKVAHTRRNKLRPGKYTMMSLLEAGTVEGLLEAPATPLYYLDGASLRKVGGPEGLARIERGLLRKLNTDLKRRKARAFRRLILGDRETFLLAMRARLEAKLSARAGEAIQLRSRRIRDLVFYQTFYSQTYNLMIAREYGFENGAWGPTYDERIGVFNFRDQVLNLINQRLAGGEGVTVALEWLFGRYRTTGLHVVLLTGMVLENGEVKGYKYLNTWSPRFGEAGYGYIDRHTLEKHWFETLRIDEISLD